MYPTDTRASRRGWTNDPITLVCVCLALMLVTDLALAGGGGGSGGAMPWDSRLTQILTSITGPVARVGGAIAIVIAGLGMAFSPGGGMMRTILGIVFGLSIAFSAVSFGIGFFGFAAGATI